MTKLQKGDRPIKIASGREFAEAIGEAVNWCINNDCMVQYLRKHKSEVTDMWLTEYNEDEIKEAMRLDGLTEGRAEGVDALMSSTELSLEEACKALNITVEEYTSVRQKLINCEDEPQG